MHRTAVMTRPLAIWLVVTFSPLQEAQPPQPESSLIYLNVIAVDVHGDPVKDLASGDFQIADEGKPQTISFFRHRDEKPEPASSLKPNQFSNRVQGAPTHATVILYDLLNETAGERGKALGDLIRFLQPLDAANDLYFYLLTTDGLLYPVHGLADANLSESAAPWTAQIKPLLDATMRQAVNIRPPNSLPVSQVFQFPDRALNTLAIEVSRVPGRKNIVWVTGGAISSVDIRGVSHFGEHLGLSGVAIYPVPQTLIGQGLDEFAGLTGGRPNKGKEIGAAIKEARNDLVTSYEIGYFPPTPNRVGEFHKLRITCKRKGVRIQARTGYYAGDDSTQTDTQPALDSAISTNFDAAEIGLRATISNDRRYTQIEHFNLHIDANDLALPRQGSQYIAQLQIAIISYLANGDHDSQIRQFNSHYTAAERDQALKDGIEVNQDVRVEADARKVRFIVLDRESKALGSVTLPVNADVPPNEPRP
jgi:VWFA-related protein